MAMLVTFCNHRESAVYPNQNAILPRSTRVSWLGTSIPFDISLLSAQWPQTFYCDDIRPQTRVSPLSLELEVT